MFRGTKMVRVKFHKLLQCQWTCVMQLKQNTKPVEQPKGDNHISTNDDFTLSTDRWCLVISSHCRYTKAVWIIQKLSTTKYKKCVCVWERERQEAQRERQRTPVHVCSSTHPAIFVCACNQLLCHTTTLAITHHVKLPSSLIHALMIYHRWSGKLTYGLPMQVYFSFSSVNFQKRC